MRDIEKSMRMIAREAHDYEFRTTVIEGTHDVRDIIKMALWMNHVIGRRPKILYLQGFKNNGKFISPKFKDKKDTSEFHLRELRNAIREYFDKIEIRV
jgi:hypothetical protein